MCLCWLFVTFSEAQNKLMFLKMVALKDRHEAMKQEQEKAHSEQLEGLKQQYEGSLEGNLVLWWVDLFFMF